MSGFSSEWLALRAGADDRARNAGLRAAFLDALPATPRLLDLGSGTGSTARALDLPGARWTLVDNNAALLAEAKRRMPDARIVRADLSRGLDTVLSHEGDAITASALFDLVSPEWIEHFARGARGRIVYAALTYDGTESWSPDHPSDLAVSRAFDAHQRGDKGFGPAAGPSGAALLARALTAEGYTVTLAPSPWRLNRGRDGALMNALADGIAGAAVEAGCDAAVAKEWRLARKDAERSVTGHLDLLAVRV